MPRGFYCAVQYVPDRFRAEAVNVGLILLRVEPHAICVRMTENFDRTCRLFRCTQAELQNLRIFTESMKFRIESSAKDFRTAVDLAAFAASRSNDLRLTDPRLAIVENFEADFERLFSQLVDEPATAQVSEQQ